jgi:hypothetical protein
MTEREELQLYVKSETIPTSVRLAWLTVCDMLENGLLTHDDLAAEGRSIMDVMALVYEQIINERYGDGPVVYSN